MITDYFRFVEKKNHHNQQSFVRVILFTCICFLFGAGGVPCLHTCPNSISRDLLPQEISI